MPLLFAIALFLGAGLLFWIEPVVGKLLLPALGGTPAVWATCLAFFQTALLAGYATQTSRSGAARPRPMSIPVGSDSMAASEGNGATRP